MNVYQPPFLGEDCMEVIIDNILDIHFSYLKFHYHPLFSTEHVFSEKLKKLFEEYVSYESQNSLEHLRNNLIALREKRNNAQLSEAEKTIINEEVKIARELYFEKAHIYRDIIHSILNTWKKIKQIREMQSYSNTAVKLVIEKVTVDIDEDNKAFDIFFNQTLEELLNEQTTGENKEESSSSVIENETNDTSQKFPSEKKKLTKELSKTFRKIFRQPGEPLVKFLLTDGVDITERISEKKEIQRRKAVDSVKIFLKLFCNSIEICKTKAFTLTHDFNLDINESLSIQLIDIPKYLTVELFEIVKTFRNQKICTIHLPISSSDLTDSFVQKFEKNDNIRYKHNALGSGLDLKTAANRFGIKVSNKDNFDLKIKGLIRYQMEWDRKQNLTPKKNVLEYQVNSLRDIVDKHYSIDYDKLKAICESHEEHFCDNLETLQELSLEENNFNHFR